MVDAIRILTLLALTVTPVLAQGPIPGWEDLDASNLSTVYVLDDTDVETTGTLLRIDPDSVTLLVNGMERRFEVSRVKRLQKSGESLKNGAAIGALVGTGMGAIGAGISDCPSGRESCAGERVGLFLVSIGLYAVLGLGIDALISGRTTLYESSDWLLFGGGQTARNTAHPARKSDSWHQLQLVMYFNSLRH